MPPRDRRCIGDMRARARDGGGSEKGKGGRVGKFFWTFCCRGGRFLVGSSVIGGCRHVSGRAAVGHRDVCGIDWTETTPLPSPPAVPSASRGAFFFFWLGMAGTYPRQAQGCFALAQNFMISFRCRRLFEAGVCCPISDLHDIDTVLLHCFCPPTHAGIKVDFPNHT